MIAQKNISRMGWGIPLFIVVALLSAPLCAQKVKTPQGPLDSLTFSKPELHISEAPATFKSIQNQLPNAEALAGMLSELGGAWSLTMDARTGRPTLLEGGALPWIPGAANALDGKALGLPCGDASCVPVRAVEEKAREFLAHYASSFRFDAFTFVPDPQGSGPVGSNLYFLRFQPYYLGYPVQGASLYFRINNGNLIQVAARGLGDMPIHPAVQIDLATARQILRDFVGIQGANKDQLLDPGTLIALPMASPGTASGAFSGPAGTGISYALAYRFQFRRAGSSGTWQGLVDARSGEVLQFVDINRYGAVHGGVYPTDQPTPEINRPFPYADCGGGVYADAGGNFTGNNCTSTLSGEYTRMSDDCGAISHSTTTGDLDFGMSPATDCSTPGYGGAGNTRASRTQYYNVTLIKMKAMSYMPTNTWLQGQLQDNVNISSTCNAFWDGSTLNFYRSGGGCGNTGELPGVSLHEWGHGMDSNDGSGGDAPPVETYADWTAIMQTHGSCAGAGFFQSGNCWGYGDACLNCTGVRDADWDKHASHTPWTPQNNNQPSPGYSCSAGGYDGPCGWEDHCESGISSQALWDMVNRDLTAAPTNMDLVSAWQLVDRLWYSGVHSLGNMYTCTPPTSNGCGGANLYTVFRAIDDDGDGTANGTPHAAAIFSSLNRHGIACGAAGDATNQNHTSCAVPAAPVLSGSAGSMTAHLSWAAVANATAYVVYRNELGCGTGFMQVGTVASPATTFNDGPLANGTTYYYRMQAYNGTPSCMGPMSNCVNVTPQPCAGSVTMDRAAYGCAGTVGITLVDSDLVGTGTHTVSVWSGTETTPETATLAENPPASGRFTGTIGTTTAPPANGDGSVSVAHGDTITVRYLDASYCGTPNVAVDATAPVDCQGPIISGVTISPITGSSATVHWTTNEPADSRSDFGLACGALSQFKTAAGLVTNHTLVLSGLTPLTAYFFTVTSADAAGNSATDTNGGSCYTFTTTAISPDVFVGDWDGNQVLKFDPAGTYLGTVMNAGNGLSAPTGLAFMLDHSLLIASWGGVVWKTDEDGSSFSVFADSSKGLSEPVALAASFGGDVYIVDFGTNSVFRFDAAGNLLKTITAGMNSPCGIAFDLAGNYVVTNFGSYELLQFDAADNFLGVIADSSSGLYSPEGVVYDLNSDAWLVMNAGGDNILRFAKDGTFLGVFADSGDGLSWPTNASWDSNGELLAVNPGPYQVVRFSAAGTLLGIFADSADGLTNPWGIAVMGQLPLASSKGLIQFDADSYSCEQVAGIQVIDLDLNTNPSVIETATVLASSSTEPAGEVVTLTEQGTSSPIFSGTIQLSQTDAPGVLHVTNGDTITAVYNDADDGTGNPAVVSATAIVDCQIPIITNVQVTAIASDSATVTWDTNEPATSVVHFGPTPALGTTAGAAGMVTHHSVALTGLGSCTRYYFAVTSMDAASNTATDNNGGLNYVFETAMLVDYFKDDMESGINGWTIENPGANNLWHQVTSPTCAPASHSGSHSWYFGLDGACTYENGSTVAGRIRTPVIPSLTAGAKLQFWYRRQTEGYCDYYDFAYVEISTNGGSTWTVLDQLCDDSGIWILSPVYDLSAYAGMSVNIGFHFDSADEYANYYAGWMVDDVAVQAPAACHAGMIQLDHPTYTCNDGTVGIKVMDMDLNTDPTAMEIATATLQSTTEPVPEAVLLFEQGVNSSVFVGYISTTPNPPVAGNGQVSLTDGDTLTATYNDADNGTGNPAVVTATAAADCNGPLISGVNVTAIFGSSATVNWITNEAADSGVAYGLSCATLSSTATAAALVIGHAVVLTGLSPLTTYFFTVSSADASGNGATDDNGGACYSFTTTELSNQWAATTDQPAALYGHTAAAPGGCGVYVMGGGTDTLYYDPLAQTWTAKAPLPQFRMDATATAIGNSIYLPGGDDSGYNPQSSLYLYNTLTNAWSQKAGLPTPLTAYACAPSGANIYLFGGTPDWWDFNYNIYRYNSSANTWSNLGSNPYPDYAQAAVFCPDNGRIYLTGGGYDPYTFLSYNPSSATWDTTLPSLPHAHAYHGAVYADGKIFVYGGLDYSWYATPVLDIYDVASKTFVQGPDMITARSAFAFAFAQAELVADKGAVYAFGGTDLNSISLASAEEFLLNLTSPCSTFGFCDGNGVKCEITDVQKGVNQNLGIEPCTPCADCEPDGMCGITDVQKLVNCNLGMAVACH